MAVGGRKTSKNTGTREEFLDLKRKKRWTDEKSGHFGFVLYPRSLYVTWGQRENWDWKCFKETSEENIEVIRLSHVCWLDVRGKFKMSDLSPGACYEVVYVVKLSESASGWEFPITLRLSLPAEGISHERSLSLLEKPRGQWFEVKVGNFQTSTTSSSSSHRVQDDLNSEVCFDLMEHGGHWKIGLLIQGAIIRPCS